MWSHQQGCIMVDQQCRESNGKVKIMGYTRVCDEQAHHHFNTTHIHISSLGVVCICHRLVYCLLSPLPSTLMDPIFPINLAKPPF